MKVILQKDVAKLGKRHSLVEVPDGYALNKLVPQGLALPATPENLKRINNLKAEASAHFEADETVYKVAIKGLAGMSVEVKADANPQGHLFKAIKASDVYEALIVKGVTAIPMDAIVINSPIKSCGEHEVSLHFHANNDSIKINVVTK